MQSFHTLERCHVTDSLHSAGKDHFSDEDNVFELPSSSRDSSADIGCQSEPDEIDFLKEQDFHPKVLITGAKGQLGLDLVDLLQSDFNIMPTDIEEMDITNADDVLSNFTLFQPDIVIHAAAFTNVDSCETNQEDAFKVNAIGTQNLAIACQDFDTIMLYISTDYVFDGCSDKPYREYNQTRPLNVYGESKLMGEQIVRHLISKHFIIRTSWLFGAQGNNFVKTMLRLSAEKKEIGVVDDQWGRPTYAKDLAQAVVQLINTPFYGTYHISNPEPTTWCRFAKTIFEIANRETKVNALTTEEYPTPAKRPAYSVLDSFYWQLRGFPPLRPWEEALAEFMSHPAVIRDFPFLDRGPKEP